MDASDMESNVTIISTSTKVLLWDEKSEDEQTRNNVNRPIKRFVSKNIEILRMTGEVSPQRLDK